MELGSNEVFKGQKYYIEEMYAHPDYHSILDGKFDIAAIKLTKTVTLGPGISPICLDSHLISYDANIG